jgi:quinoprotein glucose dehydrogenase
VHHDLWNYDVAGEPVLATVKKDGRDVPVVLVSTKIGHLFVLDRETGKPVFPVEERPVPQGAVPDDHPSPTQPFPTHPPPLASQSFSANDVWGITEADKEGCKRTLAKLRNDGVFTPPTVQGTLLVPGSIGGMNWSGVTFDAARGLVVVNMNDLPQIVTLVPRDQFHPPDPDAPVPPGTPPQMPLEFGPQWGTPYAETHRWFLNGFSPCTPPPFGTLRAIDLASGTTKWEVPLGTMPEFKSAPGSEHWGSFNLGGNIVTRAGLVFVAASRDDMFRAFDEDTGKVLWEAHLPAGGQAAPMTYRARPGGKQYVVIAAGGHVALRSTPGDYVVAYALP